MSTFLPQSGVRPSFRLNPPKPFIVWLAITETIALLPVFFQEYLLAFVVAFGLFAVFFVYSRPDNSLVVLPIFLYLPFEIPGLDGIQFSEIGSLFVLIAILIAVLGHKSDLQFEAPAFIPLMLIILAACLSLINARYFWAGIKNIAKYIEAFVLFFLATVNLISDRKTIERIFTSFLLAGLLAALIGIQRFIQGYETRVFGLLGGGFGAYMGICTLLALSILVFSESKPRQLLALFILPILVSALLLSQTRAWLLATGCALLFMMWQTKNKKQTLKIMIILLAISGMVYLTLYGRTIFSGGEAELISQGAGRAIETGLAKGDTQGKYVSILMRLFIWMHGFSIYLKHPVFGFGIGNLRFRNFFTGELGAPSEPNVGYVDNHWLNVLYETGILGILGWIWLSVVVYKACAFLLRRSQEREWQIISLPLCGSMIIFLVGGMFWALTVVHEMTVLIPFLLGLIFASARILEKEKNRSED